MIPRVLKRDIYEKSPKRQVFVGGFCLFYLMTAHSRCAGRKKFDGGCKMAPSGDVMTATVGRVSGLSEGGSGLQPLQGASAGGPGYLRKRTSVDIGPLCPGG